MSCTAVLVATLMAPPFVQESALDPQAPVALSVPTGFTADLVARAPDIRWPSAVHCLDDGSLLVAEDPMDMIGPADQPIDRILRLEFDHGDLVGGYSSTVFADGLYAVFGIESIGPEVFVVNMPHLTRLIDHDGDGVADQRDQLVTGLGPEPPGMEGGFNDHVVSGVMLGVDGWLYVSVGDKGIPLATGSDGSTLSLRGGGVVRVLPDGSRLELVASGTRNHLDVVLDERGNMFTYDNTDDGLGWWTRLTHIVEDGYYGYPWDYQEHPERMLPCITDFGSGAPAGGLYYGEARWPLRYRGSTYWCEWGKGAIERFDFVRDEATFGIDLKEDFARAAGDFEFRPLDLCLSPDGRYMYVADWGHPGWKVDDVTGRLWRIRRRDDAPDLATRLPPTPITTRELIEDLGSPSLRLRRRAQHELVKLGPRESVDELARVLARNPVEPRRRHAVWALAALGGDQAREAIEGALDFPNEDTRIQALRALRRRGRDLPRTILDMLTDESAFIRREAATTVGYLGDAGDAVRLVRRLQHEDDPWVRWAITRALHRLDVWDRSVLSWLHFTSDSRLDLMLALRGVYDLGAIERLAWFAAGKGADWSTGWAERLAPARARAVDVLAEAYRMPEPWDGTWWSTQPAKGPPPPKTVDWEGTELVRVALRGVLNDGSVAVRRAALDAVRLTGDRGSLPEVRARYDRETDPELRRAILEVLGELRDEDAVELLVRITGDPTVPAEDQELAVTTAHRIATPSTHAFLVDVVEDDALGPRTLARAVEALGRVDTEAVHGLLLQRLEHPSDMLRAAALRTLVAMRGRELRPFVLAALDDPSPLVQREAVRQVGALELRRALPVLRERYDNPSLREEIYRALARIPDPAALDIYLAGLSEVATREASRQGLLAVRAAVLPEIEARHRAGELVEPLLGQLRALYREPSPLLDWRSCGPFELPSGLPAFEGGRFLRTLDGPGAQRPIARPGWFDHRAEATAGFVDLDELLSDETNLEAWAWTSFELRRPELLELVLGSDDSLLAWVDGVLVHEFDGARAWAPDQDRVALELSAGPHELVVRVGQGVGDWAFSVSLEHEERSDLFRDGDLSVDSSRVQEYIDYASENRGDLANGFRLLTDARRLGCVRCHRITTMNGLLGDQVGPSLDGIGARYGPRQMAISILKPSLRVASGYETHRVWTHSGEQHSGQILGESRESLILVDSSGEQRLLQKRDIAGRAAMETSVMPDGYQSLMTREEFADLVTFLRSLGGGGASPAAPAAPPEQQPARKGTSGRR